MLLTSVGHGGATAIKATNLEAVTPGDEEKWIAITVSEPEFTKLTDQQLDKVARGEV